MRKKKIVFYDSRKSISTKKLFAGQVFFIVFIIIIFSFFSGLIFTDFTDFEFSLIVLSKLIHTNILLGNI